MGCSNLEQIDSYNNFKASNNYKIYKAYKSIKNINDEIENQGILKKDQIYLLYTQSIQNFINSIEEFSKKEKSDIQRQLKDEVPTKYNFDEIEFIDEENYQNKNEFIIVNKRFLEILGIDQNDNGKNKSVIIDIDKHKNVSQIEFINHKKYNFIKLDKSNLCYRFDINNTNIIESINLNSKTLVEPNIINNNNSNNINNNRTIAEVNHINDNNNNNYINSNNEVRIYGHNNNGY